MSPAWSWGCSNCSESSQGCPMCLQSWILGYQYIVGYTGEIHSQPIRSHNFEIVISHEMQKWKTIDFLCFSRNNQKKAHSVPTRPNLGKINISVNNQHWKVVEGSLGESPTLPTCPKPLFISFKLKLCWFLLKNHVCWFYPHFSIYFQYFISFPKVQLTSIL